MVNQVGFAMFAMLNIVTGVFVDAAMQSALSERDLVSEKQEPRNLEIWGLGIWGSAFQRPGSRRSYQAGDLGTWRSRVWGSV